jgi:hypothetical protein
MNALTSHWFDLLKRASTLLAGRISAIPLAAEAARTYK